MPELGASFPFRIDERVWEAAAKVSAKGFFKMRQPPMNEHIVGGNMANILMTRAYLAQAFSEDGR